MTDPVRRGAPMKLLANSREVIELLAARGARSYAEVAEELEMPRSSVYRLIDGLAAVDLLSVDDDGQASLSLTWLHLAEAARSAMSEWSSARPVLDDLAERTGLTVFLSVPRADEAVCIDWSPGRGIGVLVLRPGRTLPLHAGGAGRTVLAFGTDDVEDTLARITRPRFTTWTKTTPAELREDVRTSRAQGFVHSDQDVTVGIGAVAVPVVGPQDQLAGCLSIAGLAVDVAERRDDLAELLRHSVPRLTSR